MYHARLVLALAVLLAFAAVPGVTQEKKTAATQEKKTVTPLISEYYPLGKGYQWTYKATFKALGTEEQPKEVTITVDEQEPYEHKFAQDKKGDGSEWIVRYRLKVTTPNKVLTEHVAVLKDGVYRFTAAGKDITPPLRFFKLPVAAGETWTVQSTSEGASITGTFQCRDEKVTVPKGTFQTKCIATKDLQMGQDKMSQETWYAPEVGMVRQHVTLGDGSRGEVTLELIDFKKGS